MPPTDSGGQYSLPLGYLAVTGTTIVASQHNPPLEDIAAALSGRLSTNGSAPMSGALRHSDGAVGLPGLTFQSDPSTGFYKTTTGFGVSIGGVKVAEFVPGGVKGARVLGELVPYTMRAAAPALFVYPVGQTLSRTTYADLWTIVQNEISSGNIFYNNGDGSTTFGIGDLRGRVIAGFDSGTLANRLTTAGSGINSSVLGSAGGGEIETLTLAQLPNGITSVNTGSIALSVTQTDNSVHSPSNNQSSATGGGTVAAQLIGLGAVVGQTQSTGSIAPGGVSVTSNNTGGTSHPNVQPTMVLNYILFAGA